MVLWIQKVALISGGDVCWDRGKIYWQKLWKDMYIWKNWIVWKVFRKVMKISKNWYKRIKWRIINIIIVFFRLRNFTMNSMWTGRIGISLRKNIKSISNIYRRKLYSYFRIMFCRIKINRREVYLWMSFIRICISSRWFRNKKKNRRKNRKNNRK